MATQQMQSYSYGDGTTFTAYSTQITDPSNLNVVYFAPGDGNSGNNYIINNSWPENTVVITLTRNGSNDLRGTYFPQATQEILRDIGTRYNTTAGIASADYIGTSRGCLAAPENVSNLIKIGVPISEVVLVDLSPNTYFTDEAKEYLNTHGGKVIMVGTGSGLATNPQGISNNMFQGVNNVFSMYYGGDNHNSIVARAFAGDSTLAAFLQGINDYPNGNFVLTFRDADGNWIAATVDELRSALSGYSSLTIPGLDLKGSYPAGTIASDICLAMSHVNEIRKNMSPDAPSELSFRSTTSFPANLGECQNALLGVSNDLTATLDRHTQLVAGIARAFYEADQQAARAIKATLADGTTCNLTGSADDIGIEISRAIALENGISFNSFMFPANGSKGGRLYLSDLTSITGGALKATVTSETTAAQEIATSISSLQNDIGNSSNLAGPAWEAVSNKLDGYHELMGLRKTAVSDFEAAAVKAANLLATWMDEYTYLDDSRLPELESSFEEVKRVREEAVKVCTATQRPWFFHLIGPKRYVYSAESRARARAYVEWANEQLPKIYKHLKKLRELPSKVAEAEQIMNNALHQIYTSYAVPVANFAGISNYTSPANTNYQAPPPTSDDLDLGDIPSNKKTEEEFNNNPNLVDKWGTYENYLNGVKAKNDPALNTGMQDNGKESTADFSIPEGDLSVLDEPAEEPGIEDEPTVPEYRQQTPASTPSYTPSYTPSQTPSTTTPSTETPTIEPTPEPEPEPTLIETPVEVTPIEVTPIDETPIEPTIAEETPTDTTPVEATPVEETPAEPTPVEHTPTEATEVSGTPIVSTKPDRPSTSSPSTPSRKPDPEPEIVEVDPQPVPIEEGTSLIGGMSSPNALEMEEDFVFGTNDDTNVVTIENPTPAITSRNDSKSIGIVAGLAAAAATGYGVYKYNKDKDEDDDSNEDFEPIDNTGDFNEDLSDEPENFVA